MDLLLLFLDQRGIASFFKRERKKLLKKKKCVIGDLQLLLSVQGVLEKNILSCVNVSSRSYYMRISSAVKKLLKTFLKDLEDSANVYPKITLNRRLVDVISEINRIQESQQEFVDHITSPGLAPAPPRRRQEAERAAAAAAEDEDGAAEAEAEAAQADTRGGAGGAKQPCGGDDDGDDADFGARF